MSGYIGEIPKKMKRGWMDVIDKNNIIRDENNRPIFGTKRVKIKKAWVGNNDREPELVLDSDDYYISNKKSCPIDFNYAPVITYNNKIHILNNGVHYSWNGNEWIKESDLPYTFYRGSAIVYNNRIHILGGTVNNNATNYHYSWDGTSWNREEDIPNDNIIGFSDALVVVYNNKIHILGGPDGLSATYHYSWDGTSWFYEGHTPYNVYGGSAVVYNEKIHILGGSDSFSHYSWNGNEWISEERLPGYIAFKDQPVFVYDNKINLIRQNGNTGYSKYYLWDGEIWAEESEKTLQIPSGYGKVVIYNNRIHFLKSNIGHYSWNGVEWVSENTLPREFYKGSAVVYNDDIHIIGGGTNEKTRYNKINHFKLIRSFWKEDVLLPYEYFNSGCAVVYNNRIHVLGGIGYDPSKDLQVTTYHYSIGESESEFTKETNCPFSFRRGSAIVYNNRIHILGGDGTSASYVKHYSWDGTSWTQEADVDSDNVGNYSYGFSLASAVVYNDKIYVIGGISKDGIGYPSVREIYYDEHVSKYVTHMGPSLPEPHFVGGSAVVYDNKIHIFGNSMNDGQGHYNLHYSFDGVLWKKEWDIPYSFYNGAAVVINNEIVLIGGEASKETMLKTNLQGFFS